MRSAMRSAHAAMSSAFVTGRKRRCGWFDAALVQARRSRLPASRGPPSPASTLDARRDPVSTGYTLDGERIDSFPPIPASRLRSSRSTSSLKAGRLDGRRLLLLPGAGRQICSLDRGDRVPGHAALYQPEREDTIRMCAILTYPDLEPPPAQFCDLLRGLPICRDWSIRERGACRHRLLRRLARHLRSSPPLLRRHRAARDRVVAYALLLFRANACAVPASIRWPSIRKPAAGSCPKSRRGGRGRSAEARRCSADARGPGRHEVAIRLYEALAITASAVGPTITRMGRMPALRRR